MGFSFGHLILLLIIVLLVFGAGKIPQVMKDVAKGVKAFKEGMNDESTDDVDQKEVEIIPPSRSHQKTGTDG